MAVFRASGARKTKVTVHRDENGFWQLEEDYIRALGRAAEIHGRQPLEGDIRFRLYEVEKAARESYVKAPARMRTVADVFAAGYNHHANQNPGKPRLLRWLEGGRSWRSR